MFSSPLNLFKSITKIPRPSGDTALMREFLVRYAGEFGAKVSVDKAGNILAQKGENARLCLQAHYDMVCVGKAPEIEVYEEDGWLKAHDSSLGADNGVGVACALLMLKQESNLEVLFTNDEEIGMLGAKALELIPQSKLILNLDSENLREIIVSCAGGYDIELSIPATFKEAKQKYSYEIATQGFLGGHSGVDIIKNRPNALSELAWLLGSLPANIASFSGGEKSNSIPVHAHAFITTNEPLTILPQNFRSSTIPMPSKILHKSPLLPLLRALHSGVYAYDEASAGVVDSLNISLLKQEEERFILTLMGRANSKALLERNLERVRLIAKEFGIKEERVVDFYPPWERAKESPNLEKIYEIFNAELGGCAIRSIHAGLECAILQGRIPGAEFISIGPTIRDPHSVRESLEIKSLNHFWELLQIIPKIL